MIPLFSETGLLPVKMVDVNNIDVDVLVIGAGIAAPSPFGPFGGLMY